MRTSRAILMGSGFAILALAVLAAAILMSGTPGSAIDDSLVPAGAEPVSTETVRYILPDGRSAGEIGDELQALGVIRSGRQFKALVALMGLDNELAAGTYDLPLNASTTSIINAVTVKESVPTVQVTFPEGIRIEEMAVLVEESGIATREEFLLAASPDRLPPAFAASLPEDANLQGYLFPDTYILPLGSTADDLVQLMIDTLAVRFSAMLRDAATERGLTFHEVLTLASIVEREAALEDERPIIASVFFNRLAIGEILGADATVQFAVALDPESVQRWGWWKPGSELTVDDLALDSPYNTRLNGGIPPGPITNPGLKAIEAVVFPADTPYFFYVADAVAGDGSHLFAETIEEHEANRAIAGQSQ